MKKFKPNYSFADLWKQFVMFTKNWRRKSTGELVNKDKLELGDVTANDVEANDIDARDIACRKVTATGQVKGSKFVGDTSFETIKDRDGHLRFVEGDIDIENITGVTKTYGKWSLSGTHLMLALSLNIDDATSIPNNAVLSYIELPEWIHQKLEPITVIANTLNLLEIYAYGEDYSRQLFTIVTRKDNDNKIAIRTGINPTTTQARSIRIQFDFVIDNAESE